MNEKIEKQIKQIKKFNDIYHEGVSEAQEEKTMKDVAWNRGYKQGQQDVLKKLKKKVDEIQFSDVHDIYKEPFEILSEVKELIDQLLKEAK